MPPLPADSIHARACKLKCEKILTRPGLSVVLQVFGDEREGSASKKGQNIQRTAENGILCCWILTNKRYDIII
ncbi:hypothetical protein ABHB30_17725, partial [Flavonifractor plautii]